MAGLKQNYWQNYLDGNWVDGGAGRLTVGNPGTGEPLAEIALADAANIDRARHLRGSGHGQCLCGENARAGPD